MEPNQNPIEPNFSTNVSNQSKLAEVIAPLHRVTPVSKILAAVVMIVLPFAGFWVGYKYVPGEVTVVPLVIAQPEAISEEITPGIEVARTLDISNIDQSKINHFLFEGRKTGYFSINEKVYLGHTEGTVNLPDAEWDWVVVGPAKLISEADANTFKVVSAELAQTGSLYAIDSENAYNFDVMLPNVDIQSLEIFGGGGSFLISNEGLYVGTNFITSAGKDDTEVFVMNKSEGMSEFHVYVHNLVSGEWLQGGFGVETKKIQSPKLLDLKADLKIYPVSKDL